MKGVDLAGFEPAPETVTEFRAAITPQAHRIEGYPVVQCVRTVICHIAVFAFLLWVQMPLAGKIGRIKEDGRKRLEIKVISG